MSEVRVNYVLDRTLRNELIDIAVMLAKTEKTLVNEILSKAVDAMKKSNPKLVQALDMMRSVREHQVDPLDYSEEE